MNTDDQVTPEEQQLASRIKIAYEAYRLDARPLPRHRPLRRWFMSFAAVAAVVVVGAVVSRPPSALATWTREPTSSELEALTDATEDACREQAVRRQGVGAEAGWPDNPGLSQMADLPVVAHDRRGAVSAALFADEESASAAVCVIIPVGGQPDYVELNASTEVAPEEFGGVSIWTGSSGSNWDYGSRWDLAGRVSPEVDELVIVRADGERVTATVHDGWFLAWWPHSSHPAQLQVTRGDDVEIIDLRDRYDVGGPPCRLQIVSGFCLWSY